MYYKVQKRESIFKIVAQINTLNAYRNYNYLIACEETGEALAIDPLAYEMCLKEAKSRGWKIIAIANTHEHFDHIGGNQKLINSTNAKLYAHIGAKDKIPGMDVGLSEGDVIKIGNTVELKVLDTPGHTMSHICLLSLSDVPALFSGDTLFNAGAGNCHNGGHPEHLYKTFNNYLFTLNDKTLIYPGHDYLENNLEFTLNIEPTNETALKMKEEIKNFKRDKDNLVINIGSERKINTFFRLKEASVIMGVKNQLKNFSDSPSDLEVFLALRQLRNSW